MRGRWTSGGRPLSADRSEAEIEPPTYRLGGGRSILLSYMDIKGT